MRWRNGYPILSVTDSKKNIQDIIHDERYPTVPLRLHPNYEPCMQCSSRLRVVIFNWQAAVGAVGRSSPLFSFQQDLAHLIPASSSTQHLVFRTNRDILQFSDHRKLAVLSTVCGAGKKWQGIISDISL